MDMYDEIIGTIENPLTIEDMREFGIRSEQLPVEFSDEDIYED